MEKIDLTRYEIMRQMYLNGKMSKSKWTRICEIIVNDLLNESKKG